MAWRSSFSAELTSIWSESGTSSPASFSAVTTSSSRCRWETSPAWVRKSSRMPASARAPALYGERAVLRSISAIGSAPSVKVACRRRESCVTSRASLRVDWARRCREAVVKFDVFCEAEKAGPIGPDHEAVVLRDTIAQARVADAEGFGCWWVVEHHGCPESSYSSAPEILLAWIESQTERI